MRADILPKLDKVRRRGSKYTACCPVHNDKTPSLSLEEPADRVLIHCFGCQANGIEVMDALGLSHSFLFRDSRPGGSLPMAVREKAEEDVYFIAILDGMRKRGERIPYDSYKRYKLAKERVKLLERA